MKKALVFILSLSLVMFFTVSVAAEEVTITVAGGAVGQELEMTEKAAEMYMEENPDVVIEVLDTPDLAQDRLGLYLQFFEAQSSEVDVFQIDVIWPGDLSEHFVDLYDYGADEVVDMHFDEIVENNTVDGELIAIPWFTDAGLLYYRTDLLEKYDLDVPETWTELEEAAQTIQDGEREEGNEDFVGFVWQGDAYEGLTTNALEWFASSNAGTIISDDGYITVNNERAVEVLEMAAGWVGTISPSGVTGMAEEDARAVFQGGNAAFMRNWPYAYALAQDEEESAIAGNFDVSTLPAAEDGEPAHTLGGWNLAVSQYSENPEIAADVALYLAGYESQKMRAVEASMNPTIEELYEDEEVLEAVPFFGELYDVFVNAVARPSTVSAPNYNQVSEYYYQAVHSVLTGQDDALTALEYLELDLQDLTGFEIGEPQH
ncbi:ABC transporter substrate-binding protein [Halanaerobiaceae bacterium Z-7014]|uniref:ABC transporter substrate-binding protein n=1 Tax=Halonatronomonas betaini TaxID=2778430 RepID=A0A931ATY5_9FIRM|nr:ABC transporter substrate-binding protein [Halonatronomonas betaini]MBF8436599.1 ABC transporter substrate-binding protein [Halonatronomonas betaini]